MPTYDYKCLKCGHEFVKVQKMSSRPGAKCTKCGGKSERQMSAGSGLVFKGSGFYITDYKRAGEKKPEGESKSDGAKGDSAPAAAPAPATPAKKKDD